MCVRATRQDVLRESTDQGMCDLCEPDGEDHHGHASLGHRLVTNPACLSDQVWCRVAQELFQMGELQAQAQEKQRDVVVVAGQRRSAQHPFHQVFYGMHGAG